MARSGRVGRPARAIAALVAVALLLPSAADGKIRDPHERRAAKRCAHGHVSGCLKRAALHHHIDYRLLRSIAWCESRLQPRAYNPSGAGGLMQFMPGTWASNRYAAHSRYSAKWAALGGAWLIRRVGTGPWAASRHCWGQ